MTNSLIAVDTNILIYLIDNGDFTKRSIAKDILSVDPQISTQVISEFINVARRILKIPKEELLFTAAKLLFGCGIMTIDTTTLMTASTLCQKYQFQLFDAVIVASALEGNCDILYSEDMHNGLVVNGKLKIINPFS
jgi:predicted nucleic acid-binding protein